jgi:hypothetical protein
MKIFITLLENVNKSRISAGNLSLTKGTRQSRGFHYQSQQETTAVVFFFLQIGFCFSLTDKCFFIPHYTEKKILSQKTFVGWNKKKRITANESIFL